jgi:putative protease
MKSVYYAANVTRIYRTAIDCWREQPEMFAERLPEWLHELELVSHRPYTDNLFNEFGETGFTELPTINRAMFLGFAENPRPAVTVDVNVSNPLAPGDGVEAICPGHEHYSPVSVRATVIRIEANGREIGRARPGTPATITFDCTIPAYAVLRRIAP